MNSNRHEHDYGEILASLRRETEHGLEPALESRLLQRVELSVAGLSAPILDGLHGLGKGLGKASLADNYSASLALHPIATLATTLVLGGILGAVTHARLVSSHAPGNPRTNVAQAAPVASIANVRSVASQAVAISVQELPLLTSASEARREPLSSHPRAFSTAQPETLPSANAVPNTPSSDLAKQVTALEGARAALTRKDPAAALQALQVHAQEYPNSPLTEEREALVVKSLVLSHRIAEARSQLARFERQFPNSLLLPALQEAVVNIP
jgi:hypothetical protein